MQYLRKSTILGAGLLAVALLVSGCDSGGTSGAASGGTAPEVYNSIDVSQAALVTNATKVTGGDTSGTAGNFSFPEISSEASGLSMTIPGNSPPAFPARRTLSEGNGQAIGFGDSVVLKYDMFSWAGGELVESSSLFEEAHTVEAGVSDRFPIPEYLAKSLLGRSLGDTIQVVLPVGTEDLPNYLDPTDAYVLLIELL